MNVTALNNSGGAKIDLAFSGEEDDGAFVTIQINSWDTGREILDLIISDPNEVDALEQAVAEAVADYRRKAADAAPQPTQAKAKRP